MLIVNHSTKFALESLGQSPVKIQVSYGEVVTVTVLTLQVQNVEDCRLKKKRLSVTSN